MVSNLEEWIEAPEHHGELIEGKDHYTSDTKTEVLAMSGATIDCYLKNEREKLELKGISTTKPGALLRNSSAEVEAEPGFFEIDTVAHCGPTI